MDLDTDVFCLNVDLTYERITLGEFLDKHEPKISSAEGKVCRHSLKEIHGEWYVFTKSYFNTLLDEIGPFSEDVAAEKLLALRISDIDQHYIIGKAPTFYETFSQLADYIVSNLDDKHISRFLYLIKQHKDNYEGELDAAVWFEFEQRLEFSRLEEIEKLENSENTRLEFSKADPNQLIALRKELTGAGEYIVFKEQIYDLEYPKVSRRATGEFYDAVIKAGFSENDAQELYDMAYRALEIEIIR